MKKEDSKYSGKNVAIQKKKKKKILNCLSSTKDEKGVVIMTS
jgi:hypothetical protein